MMTVRTTKKEDSDDVANLRINTITLQGKPVDGLYNTYVEYSYWQHGKHRKNTYWCWAKDELDAFAITKRKAEENGWAFGPLEGASQ